jgi:NADPH2:quinone reductase
MHAIEITETGNPDVLHYVEKPLPTPGAGEVLIKAEAIGVNFIDTYFRTGLYPHQLPFFPGSEVSGTVAAVGAEVSTFQAGDRVASADAIGAYAEYCNAPVELTAHVPDDVSVETAASALLKGLTAHFLIKSVYPVQPGDDIPLALAQAASG